LAAYALVPDLIAAGATAFKIEGRLKTPEYVANITRHYRQAIDSALAGRPVEFTPRQVEEMELSFSRGFSVGWLGGCDHKMLVPATSSAKRGVLVGEVIEVRRGRLRVELCGRLKAGDGVAFEGDRAAGEEQGGRVFALYLDGRRVESELDGGAVEIAMAGESIDLARLRPGQKFWKNDDPALTKKLRQSFAGELHGRSLPIEIEARAAAGRPLRLVVRAEGLATIECETDQPLDAAIRHPLTRELLEEQLGRLGGSGFVLSRLSAEIDSAPMAPLSVLGKLRHAMIEKLQARREAAAVRTHAADPEPVLPRMRKEIAAPQTHASSPTTHLHVLCRSLHQLRAALAAGADLVYVDFQDIREYRPAVAAAHQAGAWIFLATPRIQKPDEMGIFRVLARHGADGILVRNLSGLEFFAGRGLPCVADFSLNAANELTVDYLMAQGAARVTACYDLNRDQLLDLARHAPAERLEVVVHQHMPMFHMEHCVFCAVLSPGTNKTNCGRPCDVHQVLLRDRVGAEHPLKADVGCRNTLFNAVPQSGAEVIEPMIRLGVRHFRVELLHDDPPPAIRRTLELYRDLIGGKVSGREVWTSLKAVNRVGVTRGTLEDRRNPLAIL
jgi:putative protease